MEFFILLGAICILNIVRTFATRGIYSSKARYYDYVNDKLIQKLNEKRDLVWERRKRKIEFKLWQK